MPDTPEWRAQADIAFAARTILNTRGPESGVVEEQSKLTTLREFVAHGYKTMGHGSM
jgi:hypothetical protein